jgi:hypothetical protein
MYEWTLQDMMRAVDRQARKLCESNCNGMNDLLQNQLRENHSMVGRG